MKPVLNKALFGDTDYDSIDYKKILFNIPKEKFRCYNTEPSIQQLWSY